MLVMLEMYKNKYKKFYVKCKCLLREKYICVCEG